MKGNKVFWFLVVLLILAIGLMLLPNKVGAEAGYPKGVQVFSVEDHTCVLYNGPGEASIDCFCPCEGCVDNTITYTDDVDKPKPTKTKEPPPDPPKPTPTDNPVKYMCHVPPGNPKNAHTIGCKTSGCLSAHLAHHDDYLGKCK